MKFFCFLIVLFCISAHGQLAVTVAPPKVTGEKAIVQLTMTNELADKVQAARAICILTDDHGKMVGQSTKWVIGQNKTHLDPKGEAKFDFVITTPKPLISSNLTAKIMFSRVILDGGKLVNPKNVTIIAPAK